MFEVTRELFKSYCAQLAKAGTVLEHEYQIEVDERLTNMEFIVSRVKSLSTRSACSDQAASIVHDTYLNSSPHLRVSSDSDLQTGFLEHRKVTMPLRLNETEIRVLTEGRCPIRC
jgi:hypothetical protein